MKYFLAFGLLFSTVWAQSLPQQYASLSSEQRQQYETIALKLKPTLKPLEASIRAVALNERLSASARLQELNTIQAQLSNWVGNSVLKYTLMLPISSTLQAQSVKLATSLPLRIPYRAQQIKAQFNISGAQLYGYGNGNLTLVRGQTQLGSVNKNDKVIVYFKQGGPFITQIKEVVTDRGDAGEVLLLADLIEISRFSGGAALFIPQS